MREHLSCMCPIVSRGETLRLPPVHGCGHILGAEPSQTHPRRKAAPAAAGGHGSQQQEAAGRQTKPHCEHCREEDNGPKPQSNPSSALGQEREDIHSSGGAEGTGTCLSPTATTLPSQDRGGHKPPPDLGVCVSLPTTPCHQTP